MQLSDYNFTSITCEKSASSLTLPNSKHRRFSLDVPGFPIRSHNTEPIKDSIHREQFRTDIAIRCRYKVSLG